MGRFTLTSSSPHLPKERRTYLPLQERHCKSPHVRTEVIPMPCMHCDHPPCVTVCPAKATFKRDDGIVVQYYRRCIGCKYCMVACPYGARRFNYKEEETKAYHPQAQPPDRK